RLGSPWILAVTRWNYAGMLLRRGGATDRESAIALLDQAIETYQRLGMKRLLEIAVEDRLAALRVTPAAKNSIHPVASSLEAHRPDLTRHAASDGTITLLFSDVEGFGAMTERLGDLKAHEIMREHNEIVRGEIAAHGGSEVELLGDGFVLAFSSAR